MSFNYPEFLLGESSHPGQAPLTLNGAQSPANADGQSPARSGGAAPTKDGGPLVGQNTFNLPAELQGGIGTISLRRPLYAAESFTRTNLPPFMPQGMATPGSMAPSQIAPPTAGYGTPLLAFFGGPPPPRMANFAIMNNATQFMSPLELVGEQLGAMSLSSDFSEFQRRPSGSTSRSGSVSGPSAGGSNSSRAAWGPTSGSAINQASAAHAASSNSPSPNVVGSGTAKNVGSGSGRSGWGRGASEQSINLENGLMLKNQYIVALPDLKAVYRQTTKYFQDVTVTQDIVSQLHALVAEPAIIKLITFIKNLNNLTFHHKILCLVINKNGKFDLLSYPNNSNIFLQRDDLVIVDGDRGKDLVMIVEPLVNLNFAILFNFLKKLEHLRSLTISDTAAIVDRPHPPSQQGGHGRFNNQKANGTHLTLLDALAIINLHSNEDNEFIILLPTKQVLRFATPKEVNKISGKFLEEKRAFVTCFNKINELNLQGDLQLINVEYQLDFKKLIFYYFANFKRIDFRALIKELFKIYKTRIWLCAVLPYDRPHLYITTEPRLLRRALVALGGSRSPQARTQHTMASIPHEYELLNEQILNFSIGEFDSLATPNYFHLANLANLVRHLRNELSGHFYGFNAESAHETPATAPGGPPRRGNSVADPKLAPNFNPFGDNVFKLGFQLNSP